MPSRYSRITSIGRLNACKEALPSVNPDGIFKVLDSSYLQGIYLFALWTAKLLIEGWGYQNSGEKRKSDLTTAKNLLDRCSEIDFRTLKANRESVKVSSLLEATYNEAHESFFLLTVHIFKIKMREKVAEDLLVSFKIRSSHL